MSRQTTASEHTCVCSSSFIVSRCHN